MRRFLPDLTNLPDQITHRWHCHRHGHNWSTTRCDPPACINCGRTQRRRHR